jgi:hypothetical protein
MINDQYSYKAYKSAMQQQMIKGLTADYKM